MASKAKTPVPGDTIHVPPSNHATGGSATVDSVEGNFIGVSEIPGWCFHWEFLKPLQSKLRKHYGAVPARPLAEGEAPERFEAHPEPPAGLF